MIPNKRKDAPDFSSWYRGDFLKFGLRADRFLVEHLDVFPQNIGPSEIRGKVLDLGSGYGRNALYLAKSGFFVDCVDISREAIEKLQTLSQHFGLNEFIRTHISDIRRFDIGEEKYDLIISAAGLVFLSRGELLKTKKN